MFTFDSPVASTHRGDAVIEVARHVVVNREPAIRPAGIAPVHHPQIHTLLEQVPDQGAVFLQVGHGVPADEAVDDEHRRTEALLGGRAGSGRASPCRCEKISSLGAVAISTCSSLIVLSFSMPEAILVLKSLTSRSSRLRRERRGGHRLTPFRAAFCRGRPRPGTGFPRTGVAPRRRPILLERADPSFEGVHGLVQLVNLRARWQSGRLDQLFHELSFRQQEIHPGP